MEFEENEYRRSLWAIMIHLVAWMFLCQLRRKNFSIPRGLGWMTFNIFALSFLYMNSYMLSANTLGDPNSKMIYTSLVLSDALFSFFYVLLNDHLYPSGYFGFTTFPKIFFTICFYFYFDDRLLEILGIFALTTLQTSLLGLHSEELLIDVHTEEVGDDFNVLDYYTLLYLDLPYICKMCFYAILDQIGNLVFGPIKEKKE
jgi:hypothetical protein